MEKGGKSPCITVLQGKSTTVLEMEHPVVDFITICETPWPSGKYWIHSILHMTVLSWSTTETEKHENLKNVFGFLIDTSLNDDVRERGRLLSRLLPGHLNLFIFS